MLEELSNSAFSKWVASARFVYPTLLTAHGLGVAIVVGITVMIALRVLGFPRQIPLAAYAATVRVGVVGFVLNAISGVLLFVADAQALADNPSFLIKMASIVLGIVVLWFFSSGPLQGAVRQARAGGGEYRPTGADKALAVLAILIWLVAVIVSGRLIAYLAPAL